MQILGSEIYGRTDGVTFRCSEGTDMMLGIGDVATYGNTAQETGTHEMDFAIHCSGPRSDEDGMSRSQVFVYESGQVRAPNPEWNQQGRPGAFSEWTATDVFKIQVTRCESCNGSTYNVQYLKNDEVFYVGGLPSDSGHDLVFPIYVDATFHDTVGAFSDVAIFHGPTSDMYIDPPKYGLCPSGKFGYFCKLTHPETGLRACGGGAEECSDCPPGRWTRLDIGHSHCHSAPTAAPTVGPTSAPTTCTDTPKSNAAAGGTLTFKSANGTWPEVNMELLDDGTQPYPLPCWC
jgi:hypothetical protein